MTDDEYALASAKALGPDHKLVAYMARRLRELKVELGKSNSEIDHLNSEVEKMKRNKVYNEEDSREARIQIRKEEIYDSHKRELKDLREKNKKLVRDNQYLIYQLNQLKNEQARRG